LTNQQREHIDDVNEILIQPVAAVKMLTITNWWSDPRLVDRCRELAASGMSAGDIARTLCGPTRNAVISKITRSRWAWPRRRTDVDSERRIVARTKVPRHRVRKAIAKKAVGDDQAAIIEPFIASEVSQKSFGANGPKKLIDLNERECKWPVSDVGGFFFCAGERMELLPYCVHHNKIAGEKYRRPTRGEFIWRKDQNGNPVSGK
jgi:hypothetical protein